MMTRNEIGAWGEELAATHVKHQGWAVLDRNWRTRGGELDIVAFDPQRNAIVAIEVKTRIAIVLAPQPNRSHRRRSRASRACFSNGWLLTVHLPRRSPWMS